MAGETSDARKRRVERAADPLVEVPRDLLVEVIAYMRDAAESHLEASTNHRCAAADFRKLAERAERVLND